MAKNKSVVSFNFSEFLEENVKELTNHMTWMEGRSFRCAESIEEVRDFVDKAILAGLCAVDLETTGLNTRTKRTATSQKAPIEKIVSFGLCYDPKIGIHIPINHIDGAEFNLDENLVLKEIQRLCAHCVTIYHNAKFDLSFLRNYGIIVSDFKMFEDTQLLARLYDAGQKDTKLKHISERLINQPMIEYNEIAPEGKFQLISPKIGYIYGASDPMCTLDLYHFFMGQQIIIDQKSIYNLEKRVVFVVMEIESNLIKIDVPYLEKLRIEASARIKLIEQEIQTLAGEEFNVGSTQQLGKILFEKMKYRYPEKEKTASGQYKTDDKTLEKIADEFPIVKKLMEFRGLQKSLGTYIENLLNNHDEDGYVKIGFHQSGTDTGRFSSPGGMGIKEDGYSGVNVQSIPKDTEGGMPDLRKAFVARPGYKLVAADYENEEMRVATNLSIETAWIEAVNAGVDFHTKTASIISGKPIDQVQKPDRKIGKTVNFLALYLGGPMSLAAQAKISMVEAKRILADYFRGVPNLKKWMDSTIARARKNKFVKTVFGRIRPLAIFYESGDRGQEAHGDRCAVNTLVQGGCADIMKTVMVRVYNWIHTNNLQDDIRVLLTMHDELVFEIKEDKLDLYVPKLTKIMSLTDLLQDSLKWPLPLTVDVKYGDSWRMKKKFYEDFPELKERVNDSLDFHYSSQSTTNRYAIALGKTSEPDIVGELVTTPVAVPEPIPVSEPMAIPEPTPVSEPMAIPEPTPISEPVKELEPVALPEPPSEPVQAVPLSESAQPVTMDSTPSEPLKVIVPDIDMNDILSSLAPSAKTDAPVSSQESKPAENQIVMPEVSQINQNDEDFIYIVRDLKKTTSRRLNDILLFLVDEKRCESYQSPRKTLQIRDEQGHSLNVSEYKVPVDVFLALARYFGI
jgi:DNA polymerase I-like protein with 3'-5' exonuclease and polymerase domains